MKRRKKLALSKETLRTLGEKPLKQANGGSAYPYFCARPMTFSCATNCYKCFK